MKKYEDVYIYGAGNRGIELIENIQAQYSSMICVKGFIDREKTGTQNGILISTINSIPKDAIIVISIARFEIALQVVLELKSEGFSKIFWYNVWNKRKQCMDFFTEQCVDCKGWAEDTLLHVEMHAMDACNLNCVGCTHFSDIFPKEKPDAESRFQDIALLRRKISSIAQFFVLGGEPFLNDEVAKYTDRVRQLYPDACVSVVTNGLLVPSLPEKLLEYLGRENICISVSEYEPTHRMMSQIENVLNQYNIIYNIRRQEGRQIFNKPLSLQPSDEYYCVSQDCINIGGGKITRCPTLMYIADLNKKFGLDFPIDGMVELTSDMSGRELKNQLNKPVPLCRYCVKNEIPWQTCGRDVLVEHFVKTDTGRL
jgi:organic radical activating enzyme